MTIETRHSGLRHRERTVIAVVLVLLHLLLVFGPDLDAGLSNSVVDGVATVSGHSSLLGLIVTLPLVALYYWIVTSLAQPVSGAEPARPWRRFVAFFIDFMLGMLIISPWLGLVPVVAEAVRTGQFHWGFERHYQVATDIWLAATTVGAAMFCLCLYFAIPLTRGRVPPGARLLNLSVQYRVPYVPGLGPAIVRVCLGFLTLCLGLISLIFAWSNKDRRVPHDFMTDSYVRKLS